MPKSWSERLLFGATALHVVLGSVSVLWFATHLNVPASYLAENVPLAILGAFGVFGVLRGASWAPGVVAWFYFFQLIQIVTPSFMFAANLNFSLNIAVGWNEGVQLGINVLAVCMYVWACIVAYAPNNSSKPTPLRGAA